MLAWRRLSNVFVQQDTGRTLRRGRYRAADGNVVALPDDGSRHVRTIVAPAEQDMEPYVGPCSTEVAVVVGDVLEITAAMMRAGTAARPMAAVTVSHSRPGGRALTGGIRALDRSMRPLADFTAWRLLRLIQAGRRGVPPHQPAGAAAHAPRAAPRHRPPRARPAAVPPRRRHELRMDGAAAARGVTVLAHPASARLLAAHSAVHHLSATQRRCAACPRRAGALTINDGDGWTRSSCACCTAAAGNVAQRQR